MQFIDMQFISMQTSLVKLVNCNLTDNLKKKKFIMQHFTAPSITHIPCAWFIGGKMKSNSKESLADVKQLGFIQRSIQINKTLGIIASARYLRIKHKYSQLASCLTSYVIQHCSYCLLYIWSSIANGNSLVSN